MNNAAKKRIIVIVAMIALVALLGVCLVACNKDSFEKRLDKKGYTVVSMSMEQLEQYAGEEVQGVEWAIGGVKGDVMSGDFDMVIVIKCESAKDAEKLENEVKAEGAEDEGFVFKRNGKLVIFGTDQGVKDAQ